MKSSTENRINTLETFYGDINFKEKLEFPMAALVTAFYLGKGILETLMGIHNTLIEWSNR